MQFLPIMTCCLGFALSVQGISETSPSATHHGWLQASPASLSSIVRPFVPSDAWSSPILVDLSETEVEEEDSDPIEKPFLHATPPADFSVLRTTAPILHSGPDRLPVVRLTSVSVLRC